MTNAQIMVVEDEGIVAKLIQTMLKDLGYTVYSVTSSGEEAVKKAQENKPDLVLMDIRLKGNTDGIEATEQIQTRFDIPVVYLTAYADEDTLHQAKVTEPYGYILKPIQVRELHAVIETALYKHRIERKLKESKRWLAATLNSIADAVIATDKKGAVVFMNPVAEVLTGWKQKDAVGKDLADIFKITNEGTRTFSENPVTKALRGGVTTDPTNHILIAKDGTEIPIDDRAASIRGDKGNITGVVLIFRDITERKKTQEELQHTLEKLRGALGATIQALALTVEVRDAYTAGHQQRVTNLARAIAAEMQLSKRHIGAIRMAGAIHDIGKIGVPVEILNKPLRLGDIEFALIKIHPVVGYNILKQIKFPWPVAKIVLQHHERMDGSGYPHGLSGEDILLEARILGVADVVEAMCSHRPYRPALGIDKALEEISQNRGVLYDPQVVDACVKLFTERGFKFG